MSRSYTEAAADDHGAVGGTRSISDNNGVCAVPQTPAQLSPTLSTDIDVFSFVAPTPDVSANDNQTLRVSLTTTASPTTAISGGGLTMRQFSGPDSVSLIHRRHSRSGTNAAALFEDLPLPILTTLPLSAVSSAPISARTTDVGAEICASGSNVATPGAVTAATCASSSTSPAGRSMTLLERRNNRERTALSFSCLSGLSVERLQESTRETNLVPNSDEAPMPETQGWSKTVASAALLRDYNVPSLHASLSGVSHESDPGSPTDKFHSQTPQDSGSDEGSRSGSRHDPTSSKVSKTIDTIPGAIKVVGYNILASRLASTDLYPTCPPSVLSEDYRVGLIKEELRRVDPDILLLEEISVGVHERTLGPYLRSTLGMEGHHVVITDSEGNPQCASPTPHSEAPAAVSASRAISSGTLCGAGEMWNSANATATLTSAPSSRETSARRAITCDLVKSVACVGRCNFVSHLPKLHEPTLNRFLCRCDSSVETSRSPACFCDASSTRQRREEVSQQLQYPRQPSTPLQGTSSSVRGSLQMKPEKMTIEDGAHRSSSAKECASVTEARESQQSTLRKQWPAMPPVTAGSQGPSATPRAERAVEEVVAHRRLEMDGVSIFYKASRFRVLEVIPVHFNRLAAAERRLSRYEHKKLQVNSHNVSLVVVLQDMQVVGVSRIYVVAAVHLIWQRIKAQLWQAHQILRVMEALKHKYSKGFVDWVYPSGQGSKEHDAAVTRPPSTIDAPLTRDRARWHLQDDMAHPSTGSSSLPPLQPCTPPARRPTVVPSRATTDASDSADGSGSSLLNVNIPDGIPVQCADMSSSPGFSPTAAVTCVIGGDFNSERSGPVMEYLCTGRIPGEADVMEYWRSLKSKSPVQLDHTEERRTDRTNEAGPANVLSPTPLPPTVPPPKVSGVTSATVQELNSTSLSSSVRSSLYSMDSPYQRRRRATRFEPTGAEDTAGCAATVDSGTGEEPCPLHPYTPLRKRPLNLYPGRVSDSVSFSSHEEVNPRIGRRDTSVIATVVVPPSSQMPGGPISPQTAAETFHFNRRPSSSSSSPASSHLPGIPNRSGSVGCGGGSSFPRVAKTPPQSVPSAPSWNYARRGGPVTRLLLPVSLLSMSKATATVASTVSPPNYLPFSQRRSSLDAFNSVESSALHHSGSHSVSELESVLSTAPATSCPMRLVLNTRRDTPILEFGEPGWESGNTHGRAAIPGQAAYGMFPLQPGPTQDPMVEKRDGDGAADKEGVSATLRHRVQAQASPADADAVGGGSGGSLGSNVGSLMSEHSSCFHRDLVAPASPRSHRKRRLAGPAVNAEVSSSTSPQAVRHVASSALQQPLSELGDDVSSSILSTPLQRESFSRLPKLNSKSSYTSPRSSLPLIDEVVHSIRLSDAYAPYCYRHPSRVSAMNPSTNMEGKVLDHILYEDEHVVCGGVLRLGERQELPNARVPSDHYMIGSVLIPIQELH
ncbi:hypothetical protein JKF63_03511 [Porcisia hertigi]|uniref:Endonuclease/exonuclease/phosphatase-like protein n=1 Tax=Porcisia hertigi TaxID=2761500 RepID=A0A836IGY9_9TRYP|nr:hypothetical protein JKF63_03511 [Porcisia hertigi]